MSEIIEKLAVSVAGDVLVPGDDGYDSARSMWNGRFERHPDIVLRCHDAEDVKAGVNFARENDLLLSVKGGGHAYAANTVAERGLLIDLSHMKEVEIDPESLTARVEPGVKWGDFDRTAQEHGLATTGGTASTVGVAGLTLGGGSGYLARRLGMTTDMSQQMENLSGLAQMKTRICFGPSGAAAETSVWLPLLSSGCITLARKCFPVRSSTL